MVAYHPFLPCLCRVGQFRFQVFYNFIQRNYDVVSAPCITASRIYEFSTQFETNNVSYYRI